MLHGIHICCSYMYSTLGALYVISLNRHISRLVFGAVVVVVVISSSCWF